MYRISIEGIDGSGKSTQAELVRKYLNYKGYEARGYHEPRILRDTIIDINNKLDKDPSVTDTLLSYWFGIDCYECRQQEIRENAEVIVRDRDTSISQYAYHHNMNKLGTPDEMIYACASVANKINGCDLLIFVDVPVETALKRISSRKNNEKGINYYDEEKKLQSIRANYLELVKNKGLREKLGLKQTVVVTVSGRGDIDQVYAKITNEIEKYITGIDSESLFGCAVESYIPAESLPMAG